MAYRLGARGQGLGGHRPGATCHAAWCMARGLWPWSMGLACGRGPWAMACGRGPWAKACGRGPWAMACGRGPWAMARGRGPWAMACGPAAWAVAYGPAAYLCLGRHSTECAQWRLVLASRRLRQHAPSASWRKCTARSALLVLRLWAVCLTVVGRLQISVPRRFPAGDRPAEWPPAARGPAVRGAARPTKWHAGERLTSKSVISSP